MAQSNLIKINLTHRLFLLASLILTGCSINVAQTSSFDSAGGHGGDQNSSNTKVPVAWKDLGLQGRLVYVNSALSFEQTGLSNATALQILDLENGNVQTIFQAPDKAWIDFVSASPDGKQLAIEYVPSNKDALAVNPGQQTIYIMPSEASQPPMPLVHPLSGGDVYQQPIWSPDGTYIYFVHSNYQSPFTMPNQIFPVYEIFRMKYPGGPPEKLIDKAFWPKLSMDGSLLVYVSFSPVDGSNRLFVAAADGSNQHQIPLSGSYIPTVIDAPSFSLDNKVIYFSAATPPKSFSMNLIDRLFGVTVASAHVVKSDWWSVPVDGGTITQLTHISTVGMFGEISPDYKHVALHTGSGLLAMNLDGTGLTVLVKDVGGSQGSVSWMP